MKKLLPQANTFATVVCTFKLIGNSEKCTLDDIAEFNRFDKRQAAYYSNACYFLGLIENDLSLSPLGKEIMEEPRKAKERIYELLVKHELIGQLFAKTLLYPKHVAVKEGKEIVRKQYPEYGEAVIDRRTKCLIGWCEEVIDYVKNSK